MNDTSKSTSSYLNLSSQAYALTIDAFASANQRALGFTKSIFEIVSRPYASGAPDAAVRDGFERVNQIVDLTVGELQSTASKNAELTEKIVAQANALGEQWTNSVRGAVKSGLSNVSYVREAAETQMNGFSKRVEEMQTTTTGSTKASK